MNRILTNLKTVILAAITMGTVVSCENDELPGTTTKPDRETIKSNVENIYEMRAVLEIAKENPDKDVVANFFPFSIDSSGFVAVSNLGPEYKTQSNLTISGSYKLSAVVDKTVITWENYNLANRPLLDNSNEYIYAFNADDATRFRLNNIVLPVIDYRKTITLQIYNMADFANAIDEFKRPNTIFNIVIENPIFTRTEDMRGTLADYYAITGGGFDNIDNNNIDTQWGVYYIYMPTGSCITYADYLICGRPPMGPNPDDGSYPYAATYADRQDFAKDGYDLDVIPMSRYELNPTNAEYANFSTYLSKNITDQNAKYQITNYTGQPISLEDKDLFIISDLVVDNPDLAVQFGNVPMNLDTVWQNGDNASWGYVYNNVSGDKDNNRLGNRLYYDDKYYGDGMCRRTNDPTKKHNVDIVSSPENSQTINISSNKFDVVLMDCDTYRYTFGNDTPLEYVYADNSRATVLASVDTQKFSLLIADTWVAQNLDPDDSLVVRSKQVQEYIAGNSVAFVNYWTGGVIGGRNILWYSESLWESIYQNQTTAVGSELDINFTMPQKMR